MERQHQIATWFGAILGVCLALLVSAHGQVTEEFHQVYPLSADGKIELQNVNGGVRISAWDRNEVKVDAIKSANDKQRLDEAKVVVDAEAGSISIRTRYTDRNGNDSHVRNNPAEIEYTLTVPRQANLDEIKLVNGSLEVQNVAGEVHASTVNGNIEAKGLGGAAKLSSVNGSMNVALDRLGNAAIEISSVNGNLDLTLPSDSKASLEASDMQGGVSDDFGLPVHHHLVGHQLRGELGGGGASIRLKDVNGRVEIHHANDGRTLSPAKDSDRSDRGEDDI